MSTLGLIWLVLAFAVVAGVAVLVGVLVSTVENRRRRSAATDEPDRPAPDRPRTVADLVRLRAEAAWDGRLAAVQHAPSLGAVAGTPEAVVPDPVVADPAVPLRDDPGAPRPVTPGSVAEPHKPPVGMVGAPIVGSLPDRIGDAAPWSRAAWMTGATTVALPAGADPSVPAKLPDGRPDDDRGATPQTEGRGSEGRGSEGDACGVRRSADSRDARFRPAETAPGTPGPGRTAASPAGAGPPGIAGVAVPAGQPVAAAAVATASGARAEDSPAFDPMGRPRGAIPPGEHGRTGDDMVSGYR